MSDEYRAIVRTPKGMEVPFHYMFKKPDVNWGGYFHDLRAHQVRRPARLFATRFTRGWACE